MIRKAAIDDIDAIEKLYDELHTAEEKGEQTTGWIRGVYPVRATAEAALQRDDLFVLTDGGNICGAAIINNIQVDSYARGQWEHDAAEDQVCVLHTLAIAPHCRGKGWGRAFVKYYEDYALKHGCTALRIDTNAINTKARAMYQKCGYKEIGVVPTDFNGIPGINLVLLEKYLGHKTE